jgi:polar amino acid transport system substrate-binding protein
MLLTACSADSPASSNTPEASPAEASTSPDTSVAPEPEPTEIALTELLPADIREAGKLTLATDPNYPPCQFFEEDSKEMVGFEVDLWNAVGEKLGVEIDVVSTTFDNLIPGVQSGRYKISMECLTDNPEREEIVDIVNYAITKGAIFTLEENPKGISEDPLSLCGNRIAVQSGMDQVTTAKEILSPHCTKAGKEEIEIQTYSNSSDTLLALYSGRADFIITDLAAGVYMEKTAPKPLTYFNNDLLPSFYWGAIVNKDSPEIRDAFLAGFQAIMDDGTYAKIMEKWGISDLMIDEAGLNLATNKPRPIPTP